MATSTASEGIGSRLVMADLSGMGFEHPHSRDALTRPWPPRAARACCLKAARAALLTRFLSSFPRGYGHSYIAADLAKPFKAAGPRKNSWLVKATGGDIAIPAAEHKSGSPRHSPAGTSASARPPISFAA